MTTLGTATILIHGDDRHLQAVLAKIPQSMERVAAAVQSVSVSAFGKAGAAAGKSFADAFGNAAKAIKIPAIPAPTIPDPKAPKIPPIPAPTIPTPTMPGVGAAGAAAGRTFGSEFRAQVNAAFSAPFSAGKAIASSLSSSIGASIQASIGSSISRGLGAGVGFVVNTKNFAEFDTASRKVAQLTKDQKGMERAAAALSKELKYGTNSVEVLVAGYETLSSGFSKTKDVADILRPAIKATIASQGEAKLEKVNDAITSIINSYKGWGYGAKDAAQIVNQISGTVDAGKIKYGQYASQIGKAASVAASAGIPLSELNAAIAKATISGQMPEAVLSGIPGLITNISKPTAAAVKTAAELGIEFNAGSLKAKGLLGVMESIAQKTEKLGAAKRSEVIQNLFTSVRGKNIATAIINDTKGSRELEAQVKSGNVDKNYQLASGGIIAQQKAFKNRVIELDLKLKQGAVGDALATGLGLINKAIEGTISAIEKLDNAYKQLSPEQKQFVSTIGGIAAVSIGLVASIAAVGVVVGAIAAPLSAAAALAVSFAGGLGTVAVVAAPIAIPIAAASAAVFGLAKAFGATDSQAFTAALATAGVALAALFGPAIVSSAVAGATAIATSLSTVAVAAWAAAAPFLPFIAIAAGVVAAVYLLYKAFQNPTIQKWAKDAWDATTKWFADFGKGLSDWAKGFASSISRGFANVVDFFRQGWAAISGTSSNWVKSASTTANDWGSNFNRSTATTFAAIGNGFVSGWAYLTTTATSFTNATISTLSAWWSAVSKGFVDWMVAIDKAVSSGWNAVVNGVKSFVNGAISIVSGFNKTSIDYFVRLSSGIWAQLQQWFPWLGSIGTATNKLGLQIRGFKDLAIGAFITTVRAGQDLGRGIVRAFDDVVNSIKGMLDWVGQIPANFNRAIDSINIFKDRSREAQAQAQPVPQPAPAQQTQPQPNGKPNYGSNLGASSKSSANDGGVLVASSDLSGLGINFSKSVSESGTNFKNAIAQAARISEVSSPIANIRSAQEAATFQPPLAIQRPEAYRNRKGKGPNIHGAVDYPAPVGTPVLAAFDGEVTYEKVPYATKYGKYTGAATLKAIDAYGNEIKLRYFHLGIEAANKINTTEAVKAGQIIGRVGRDGEQGGNTPHLDLKAYVNGKKKLDPRVVLQELLRQQGSIASSTNASRSNTSTTSPIKVVYPDGIDRTDSKSTPRLPAPQPKPSPQQPKFIEPIVKTESQAPDSASTRSEIKAEPGTVNVSTEVNVPPSPDRPLLGSIAPTDERSVAQPQLPAAILGTNEGIEITKFPPLEFARIPTVKLEGLGSKPIVSAAPTPSTAPAPNASVTVGASVFTPGGGGINGPEKDVKGKRLTRNDKAIAIPGLANGGIENVLPYGTIVRVTNPATGKSTEAAVRDAGPFVGSKINRQADLTDAVAKAIGFKGTGNVELKVVKLPPGFDPNKMYQIGDTKKFGSDKKSNVIPGPSISGGGSIASSDIAQSSKSTSRDDKLETLQTRYERALADREEIERIGSRKATGRKGTNKSEVQTRYNQAYSTKLEKARRREEDAKAALEKARSTTETSNPLDDLKAEVDRIISISAAENAKTDKAVADPKSPITTKEADRFKAGRLIAQFNALTPLLERAKAFREVNPGNADVAEKVRQIEAAIYALGKDMEEAKTKVSGQTLDAAKERIDLIFANASKRETQTSLDLKSGKLTQAQAKERDRDSKVRLAKELATQEVDIARFATVSTRRDEVTGFNELLTRIKTARAEAIAAVKADTQEKFGDYISNRIEAGQKQIEELANARKAGSISEAEEAQKALDVRIATSNELQNTIDKLTYLKALSDNADESKIFDEQIRKINAYYAETAQAKNEYYANVFKSREESIFKTETKRTTEVNRADELSPDRNAREIEQSERTLLVIRQQSVAELKKLKVEIENYRDSLTEADLQTRASLNEQIDRIRAKEVEVAKATQEADKNAVRLRETTKAIATTGQDSFKSLFLDAANGFRNIGSIVDNLINKIADIGLNAIFDSLIYNNKGGGGIFGDILGFLGFNSGGEVPSLTGAGAGAMAIANFNNGGTVGKAFGAVAGLQAALKREGAGGVPIVAKAGEEVLTIPDAQLYRSLVGSGEWDRIRQISNYASGGTIGAISNTPTTAAAPRFSNGSSSVGGSPTRGTLTVDRINNVDYVSVEQLVAYVDIKMPEAARAGAALSTQNLSNTNYRQQNGLNNR